MPRITSRFCDTWHSTSCRRTDQKTPCGESSSEPVGTTPTSPACSDYSEMRLPCAAGAKAIAKSSWSVAEAQGYRDGEAIPIALAEKIVARIAAAIDAPVTVDFEGGYSEDGGAL